MSEPLLATKFYAPPLRAEVVSRPRLTGRLLEGLNRPGSFALLSSPAGSGKTTLLAEMVASLRSQVKSPSPDELQGKPASALFPRKLSTSHFPLSTQMAWLSLDQGDNDPARFWTYLISACQRGIQGVGEEALASLEASQALPQETIATLLINDLAGQDRRLVLVLDDYHAIQDESIHAAFSFLLDHLPDNLHLVLSTRLDPPWPLARYRARGRLVEIRSQDLRFSYDEAAEFLNRIMGLNLSAENVAALEKRTEGWVSGLQLAAIAMQSRGTTQGRGDIPAFIEAFTGSHLYVADYLLEEVLQNQTQEVQDFLLQTSILDRLNAELCGAVVKTFQPSDQPTLHSSQENLEYLRRANLFLVPLDDRGQWFRYHHLFADLLRVHLRQSLPEEKLAALHLRAAEWYQSNGFETEAIHHALAARDFETAAALVEGAARSMIFSGRVSAVRDWLEALPEASFQDHPRLAFYRFWIDILQAKVDFSDQAIQEMEDLLHALPPSHENDRLQGELKAVICRTMVMAGRTNRAIQLAHEALKSLSEEDLASRARANSALAAAHGLEGRAEQAELAYRKCLPQAIAAGDYRLAAHATMVKGLIQYNYGLLHDAAHTFQSIIDMGDQMGVSTPSNTGAAPAGRVFYPAGQGYIGLGIINLEWNEMERAESYLEQGMELCRQGGLDGVFIARVQMSRLRQAKGDLDGALEEIQIPEQVFQRVDTFDLAVRQIQIKLAKRDIQGAVRWAKPFIEMLSSDRPASRLPLIFLEKIKALISRVYLAQGEAEKAMHLLGELQATAEPGKRTARLVEANLLRSLVHLKQDQGDFTPEALACFERALELAEPEGYILSFLEEGPTLIPLLHAVLDHREAPGVVKEYAQVILEALGEMVEAAPAQAPGEAPGLVESLTPREMEVLQLIAAGDTNQAIADKLFITVRTVKKHSSNIYGKLNVSSRTQAVARARQLGLLSGEGIHSQ
jgi:LuxR family maltose regulon positive regulatory protein